MSLEQKEQFVLSAIPQLAEYTFPFICSVIGVVEPQTGRHYGSGLRCMFKGRRAILTALHVINEAKQEAHGFAISTRHGERPYAVQGEVNIDNVADLAAYFLPDDYPLANDAFWPQTRIDRALHKLSTDYLFLHGFPGIRSYSSQLLEGVINKSLPYGAMQRLDDDLESWQFAIEYDPISMKYEKRVAEELVDPHGLSGSPVWRIGISGHSSREWTVNDCLLVGVVTQWGSAKKMLVATSTQKLPPDW